MTKSEKKILMATLDKELELLKSFDLKNNHDLLIAAVAIVELREYLSVRDGLLAAAR